MADVGSLFNSFLDELAMIAPWPAAVPPDQNRRA